ncbi:MAG: FlgD immunoglobulin-like domain containing protein [Candidatus Krumholzibacteriota bacterium]
MLSTPELKVRGIALLALVLMVAAGSAQADSRLPDPLAIEGPVAAGFSVQSLATVRSVTTAPMDVAAARAEDQDRDRMGLAPRFALAEHVEITPDTDGTWEVLDSRFDIWRFRIFSPGALSLNLGFSAYRLPKGGRLTIYPAGTVDPDDPRGVRTFTDNDNEVHGELWTPVILSDDIVVELVLPRASRPDFDLVLTSINRGYRYFGETPEAITDKAGSCNIDVVCPEGDDWWLEIASVGVISTGGSTFCTGFMINNTAEDSRPLFMTANHCGIDAGNAASLVVYWNFESPTCGQQGGGVLNQFMTGSIHLASSSTSDFTLVEMDDPVNPDHEVSFAGWNNTSADPVSAVAIHHPSTDEKSISFENDPLTTTSYYSSAVPGDGSHLRVADWDLGTTEPGSSGSPLFDQDHRVVGQLHGGDAACGNNLPDWYGRLSVSWPSISTHLDPLGSGAETLDTFAPFNLAMRVTPYSEASFEGDTGGPFLPTEVTYMVTNNSDAPMSFAAAADVAWVDVTPGTGLVPAGGTVAVAVTANTAAAGLAQGIYAGSLTFENLTSGEGNAIRSLNLTVGVPDLVYSFDMDTDPGWTTDGDWAYGQPLGGGGEYGNPDPTGGFTGTNVYGYNLAGDYPPNLPERHLVTTALDCSDLQGVTLKFKRWLNVEQPAYDHASLAVSSDSVVFSPVWENDVSITDASWTLVEYDISSVADGQATVYLRWTMGTTDGSWQFSGWNIDDVEIWGLEDVVSPVEIPGGHRLAVSNHPNPFNPLTTVRFELSNNGRATVNIYDLKGRLVRSLADGEFTAGPHSVTWDGRGNGGRRAGSGVYLVRVVTDSGSAEHKMVMLK